MLEIPSNQALCTVLLQSTLRSPRKARRAAAWVSAALKSLGRDRGTRAGAKRARGAAAPFTRTIIGEVLRSNGPENDAQMHFARGPLEFLMIAPFRNLTQACEKRSSTPRLKGAIQKLRCLPDFFYPPSPFFLIENMKTISWNCTTKNFNSNF